MSIDVLLSALFTLLAGIGVFLMACQIMSSNLETASSKRLKTLFDKVGDNKLIGVGIGAFGTAMIQSSGAMTVMVIGFVNVGIMSLMQAATIIYGANIGTTITAQIVAFGLSGDSLLSLSTIFASLAGIGAFIGFFTKSEKWKTIGGILIGFGMLFVGLTLMSSSMEDFAKMDEVKLFLSQINNVFLLVLLGTIFTALIQSSSVMTSVALTMVISGLISLEQGIYLTMGSNIGSCVVAIIAGITSGINAKRTALIHLLFNCFGVVVFLFIGLCLYLFSAGTLNFGTLFERFFPFAPQLQLAMFHTVFNVITVIIALPLTKVLVHLCERLVSQKVDDTHSFVPHFYFVDEKMLRTPTIAIRQVKLEIEKMASVAMFNYDTSITMVTTLTFDHLDEFNNNEKQLNYLNRALIQYLVTLDGGPVSDEDHQYMTSSIRSISDLERIGDYSKNIMEYAQVLKESNEHFTEAACETINTLREQIFALYQEIMKAYMDLDLEALKHANELEDGVDDIRDQMQSDYVEYLSMGLCSASAGALFVSLASDSERIADHLINVGKTIRQFVQE